MIQKWSRLDNRFIRFLLSVGIILLFIQNVQAQKNWDRSGLTYWDSDKLQYEMLNSQKVVQLIGNVYFRKGNQELRCDRALFYDDQDLAVFKGNVFYQDSSYTLLADYFESYSNPKRELARGNVELVINQQKIFADEIRHEAFKDMVYANNNVQFVDLENDVVVTCEKLTYDKKLQKLLLEVDPKFVKNDSLGKPEITIESRIITYFDSTKVAIAEDSVVITQSKIIAQANLAEFHQQESRIIIKENPRITQNNKNMKADQIEMFFENDSLRQIYLNGKGEMLSNFKIENNPAFDQLTGAEIWIDIKDDSVRHIKVKGQAISIYHLIEEGKVQGINHILGDELAINFAKGLVKDVTVLGDPEVSRGRFYPPKSKIKSLQ